MRWKYHPRGIKVPFVKRERLQRKMKRKAKTGRRKIHVDLPEQVHQKLRVKAALEDVSMQAFVARIVDEAVKDVAVPKLSSRKKQP
jgi:hypothetical protein